MRDLLNLPNIGEVLAEKLNKIGVTSHIDLTSIGSIEAVMKIDESDLTTCYNMLYALEGAVQGIRWHGIPKEERQALKKEYDLARESK